MSDTIVELLYQSWQDLDHALRELQDKDADRRLAGLSRISWTVGHLGQQIDSWVNVRFSGAAPHPLLSQALFHTGASGEAPSWPEVWEATQQVRATARAFLETIRIEQLDMIVEYTGGIDYLRPKGLKLSYALLRTAAHHFQHTGEILTVRSLLGHELPDNWVWGEALI